MKPGQLIKNLEVDEWATLFKIQPTGSLVVRRLKAGGVYFYWRFTHDGKTEREPIGTYDSSAPPKSLDPTPLGYSIEAARRAAEVLAHAHQQNKEHGGHAGLRQKKQLEKQAALEAERRAAEFTVKRLLTEYCDYLEAQGREAHSDARSIFRLHIFEPFPQLAAMPAHACEMEDFVPTMERLQAAEKKRTSNKLRSYARAAFQVARAARSQPAYPAVFKSFGIRHNPVAETAADPTGNGDDKNPLSTEQMRLYWQLISASDDFKSALLRVHLLSGAQRIAQLVRLETTEITEGAMLLWDGKGKPGAKPRAHPIPLIAPLAAALQVCSPKGHWALSTDGGDTHVAAETLAGWAQDLVGNRIPDFQAKRLRSGVETLLARAKVSKEIRGRLQSHGVAGVQDAHYNGYDYIDEKVEALQVLYMWLTTKPELKKWRTPTTKT